MEICRKITSVEKREEAYVIHTDSADLMLVFLTDDILRIRVSFDRQFPEESYVLMLTAWEDRLDPLFRGRRVRVTAVEPAVTEKENTLLFSTAAFRLEMDREPFCIRLYDSEGTALYETIPGKPFIRDSNLRVTAYTRMEEDDCYYGFGEKGGRLNKNKEFVRERATDAMAYDPVRTDTLYKHIPFYIRLDRKSRKAVGLFYHNFYESVFNMGREKSNYWPRYSYWQADGGDIDLFLIGGGNIKTVVDGYTRLTGRPAFLPKRALGYQASSMYYAELEKDCDDAIVDFVDTAKEEAFPVDGFHLSSGYTCNDGKRCVFTWNTERFPNPGRFFAEMNRRGIQVVPNVKPGLLLSHPRIREFEQEGVFVRDSKDPDRSAVGSWWGGDGVFWDYTNARARRVWKNCLIDSLIDQGTDSVWNDNCEYDSLTDTDSVCDYDGKGGTVGQLKPLMSTLMCKLGMEAVEERHPDARPYIVCRSGGAGIQQYAQTWCGDNETGWQSLRCSIPIITGMGLSGQPNEGADIGGFAGPAPDEELFIRWVQSGVFQPRFSIHSASSDNTVTEPWMFSGSVNLIRDAIRLRYRLTPYLYSAECEASQTGAPIMRPLVYEFQNDENTYDESFEFLCGRDLLVASVLEPGAVSMRVYLPAGCRWFDWNDHFRAYAGGQTIEVPVDLAAIPVFIREGAIIPMAGNQLMSMENDHMEVLHLILAPGIDSTYVLYDDDGKTNNYRAEEFRKTEISMSGDRVVRINFHAEGRYPDFVESVLVEMIKKECSPFWVTLNGEKLEHFLNHSRFDSAEKGWYYSQSKRTVLIRYPNPRRDAELKVSFEKLDLIGMGNP